MSEVGEREAHVQRRVIAFLQDALGYDYLGNWQDRLANANIEGAFLTNFLKRQGHGSNLVNKALRELDRAAALSGSKTLYDANRAVYGLLRYGVKVRPATGARNVTVWLIDWKNPSANHFSIAEEVTITGKNAKRPDILLYVNGIALGVLELKRSTVSVAEGIRQNLDSQKQEFIRHFFPTMQLLMAGNETEGLRYGVIETPEKHWLRWKEARGRHHLAHPRQRQEPHHGLAGEMDSGEHHERQGADRHRPHRTGRADRTGLQGRQRTNPPHQNWGRSCAGLAEKPA